MKPEEIRKLDAYFKRTFKNPSLQVKARPRKDDSCELYLGDEFLGIIFRDDDDGDLSYNFSMAILDIDLEVRPRSLLAGADHLAATRLPPPGRAPASLPAVRPGTGRSG